MPDSTQPPISASKPMPTAPAENGEQQAFTGIITSRNSSRSLPLRTKLSRTSTPKVRTGCITCKKRHVKCDEAKPQCGNCLKSRGSCEGYVAAKRTKQAAGGPVQICWDSNVSAIRNNSSSSSSVVSSPVLPMQVRLNTLDFRDDAGKLYFDEFVRIVQGPWMAATSSTELWGVTLPQIARSSDTLRHAAMGIGALSMWHHQSKPLEAATAGSSIPDSDSGSGGDGNPSDVHSYQAVAHYCQSLNMLRQDSSIQTTIFMSMLLLLFESLRGNRRAALDHVNHGLALLLHLVTEQGDGTGPSPLAALAPDPRPLASAVGDVFASLGTQARAMLPGRVGSSQPLPNFNKGLRDKAQTMESFIIILNSLPRASSATIENIPAEFATLDQFADHWAGIKRSHARMGPIIIDIVRESNVIGSTDDGVVSAFVNKMLKDPRVVDFCAATRRHMHALDAAFAPLYRRIMLATASDEDSPLRLRAVHLRLRYLGVFVFDSIPQYYDVRSLEAQTPDFREYLATAALAVRAAARGSTPAFRLSLHCELAQRLLLASFMCRDAGVRRDAAALLGEYTAQDGLLSGRSLYALARRNCAVEAGNEARGEVEGETAQQRWERLWRREYVFEDGGDRVFFRFMDWDPWEERWALVEETADLRGVGVGEEVVWRRQPLTGKGALLLGDLIAF